MGKAKDFVVNILGDTGGVDKAFAAFKDNAGKAAAAAAAAFAGAKIGEALTASVEAESVTDKLSASLGASVAESERWGKAAGEVYRGAWGESMEEASAAVEDVVSSIGGMRDAAGEDIQETTGHAMAFAKAFDEDVSEAAKNVGLLMKTGLVKDAESGFDLMTAAMQKVPKALRGEVMDATSEYSQYFAQLGMSGEQAMGLLVTASADGQYAIDKTGDALKELTIRGTDMSAASVEAYGTMGLSAQDMATKLLAGGDQASGALSDIVSGLQGIKDPTTQANTAIALFGTPLEDLGTDKIPGFIESLAGAGTALGDTGGAADKLGETLQGNPKARVDEMRRSVDGWVQDLVGLPGPLGDVAVGVQAFGGDALAMGSSAAMGVYALSNMKFGFLATGATAVASGAKMVGSFVATGASAVAQGTIAAGAWVAFGARAAASFVATGAAAVAQGTITAGAWVASSARAVASFVATGAAAAAQGTITAGAWVASSARAVASFVAMGVSAAAQGAVTAAAWLASSAATVASLTAQGVALGVAKAGQLAGSAATGIATAAQWAYNAALSANPIGVVIVAIAALVAGLVWFFTQTEAGKAVVEAVWGGIQAAIGGVTGWWTNTAQPALAAGWAAISGFFRAGGQVVGSVMNTAGDIIKRIWSWSPIGLITGNWDSIMGFFRGIPGKIGTALGGVGDAIKNAFKAPFNAVAGFWNRSIGKLSFTVPGWVPGMGGKGFSFPKIPMLAEGGIVTSATLAMIGEGNEPEAVLPLSKLENLLNGGASNGAGPRVVQHITNHYPQAEPTSKTANRGLAYAAALGEV